MSSVYEANQFGVISIANEDLTQRDLPAEGASWRDINMFALTFDGYEMIGSSAACFDIRNSRKRKDLTDLRVSLFCEQRRHHHYGHPPDTATMQYIRSLVERIRCRVPPF